MMNDRSVPDVPPALIPIGMKVETHVFDAIELANRNRLDSALLHACIAIDRTAKKLYPEIERVGERYRACLREYYWVLEPMIGVGLNLAGTHFANVGTRKMPNLDFADVVYTVFRCNTAHGDEIPFEYAVTKSEAGAHNWLLADRKLHMPDLVVFALLGVAVFSRANADVRSEGEYSLTLGSDLFLIREWWGREGDLRPYADKYNQTRVAINGLANIVPEGPDGPNIAHATITQPYAVG